MIAADEVTLYFLVVIFWVCLSALRLKRILGRHQGIRKRTWSIQDDKCGQPHRFSLPVSPAKSKKPLRLKQAQLSEPEASSRRVPCATLVVRSSVIHLTSSAQKPCSIDDNRSPLRHLEYFGLRQAEFVISKDELEPPSM